jgi:hypothetical protein
MQSLKPTTDSDAFKRLSAAEQSGAIDYQAVMDDPRYSSLPRHVKMHIRRMATAQRPRVETPGAGCRKNKQRHRNKLAKASRKRNRR